VKAQHHNTEAGAVHEAHFLLSQFLHYAQSMEPERLSEQERVVLVFYYAKVQDLLAVLKVKRQCFIIR